jgi:protease-4
VRSFLKFFLAALVALIVFTGICFVILMIFATALSSSDKVTIDPKSVLVLDLSQSFSDRRQDNTISRLSGDVSLETVPLYDVIRLIHHAKTDSSIRAIYIKCNGNANGFAASEELRSALLDFRQSKKFVIAYGETITQKAYYVGNTADKIYCNPQGDFEWKGFASQMFFIKNALQKLEIEPQIFYDGKFKSATEPLREEKMTEANRLQTQVWLGDLYGNLLRSTSEMRDIDTAVLHQYANDYAIRRPADAEKYKLIDGAKYDDEVKEELRQKTGTPKDENISFVPMSAYAEAVNLKKYSSDRVAVIYAEGEIVSGKGSDKQVGADEFRNLLAKARKDKNIKAIVLRVNSPGGSALASDVIWRETQLARSEGKPVVVSMGDLAASGGYYISSGADSIFAQPNTITGSIGVFGIIPNFSAFFKNKLGVTFDAVKTAANADIGTVSRPMTPAEKQIIQAEVDTVYHTFKSRVSEGRKKDPAFIDSIAQGRVWTGARALQLGLVDKLGGLEDAIACAARMAKLKEYSIREYPEPRSFWDMLKSGYSKTVKSQSIKEELGEQEYQLYLQLKRIKEITGAIQARLPYDISVN